MRVRDHPCFTLAYRAMARAAEHGPLGDARTAVLQEASGSLLVVGLGPGHDLDHLPEAVDRVVAIEPSASMRRSAAVRVAAARARGVRVDVLTAVGEALPLATGSVNSALVALVLCSVADPSAVIREVHRVLLPGSPVGVLEHVRARDGSAARMAQRMAAPIWPHLAGGCHVDRDTAAILASAGFDTGSLSQAPGPNVPPVAPMIYGVVTRN